jgi:hypothetical protein
MLAEALSASEARFVRSVVEGGGTPLAAAERDFLEVRFGTSLADVRLHAGPQAAAAAALVDARAFCWGLDIVFGSGEYAPGSPGGLTLLAHELTHAVQNSAASFAAASAMPIGAADDPLELEADLVARMICANEPLPRIVGSAAPAIRRVIIIKAPATTGIDIDAAGVFAAPFVGKGTILFNLRRGFNAANPRLSSPGFTFKGHVGVTFDPGDPTTDFSFGWIQFMKQVAMTVIYAGREDAEGQITLDLQPLIGTAFLIDRDPAGAAFSPFAQNPGGARFDTAAQQVVSLFGDHPMAIVPDRNFNETTRHQNFLFSVVDRRKMVSIFVVRDKFARFTQLGHINSDLDYIGTFKWRAGQPLERSNQSSFLPKPFVNGPPKDPEIVSLMAKISPTLVPMYNPTANAALAGALSPPSSGRQEARNYSSQIPTLFFFDGPGSEDVP